MTGRLIDSWGWSSPVRTLRSSLLTKWLISSLNFPLHPSITEMYTDLTTDNRVAHLALQGAIDLFRAWLDTAGYSSFDPYDIWGTRFALKAREKYYRNNPLGLILIAP